MKTQLIKLQDKFILVSDEEIKEYDWDIEYCDIDKKWLTPDQVINKDWDRVSKANYCRKRGTNLKIIAGIPELPSIDFSLLSEADRLKIGYIDVEKLALEEVIGISKKQFLSLGTLNSIASGYLLGFQTAQILNDKCFSLEDMERAYDEGYQTEGEVRFKEFIQSLQQTSWDVEVEVETFWLNERLGGTWQPFPDENADTSKKQPKITNNSIKIIKLLWKHIK